MKSALQLIRDLAKDVSGEVKLALSRKEAFQKWGQHFLPSLCFAHMRQQCNNFCDPGIQNYGGNLFHSIQEKVEETFLKLPPPQPSIKHQAKPKQPKQKGQRMSNALPNKTFQKSQTIQPVQ